MESSHGLMCKQMCKNCKCKKVAHFTQNLQKNDTFFCKFQLYTMFAHQVNTPVEFNFEKYKISLMDSRDMGQMFV